MNSNLSLENLPKAVNELSAKIDALQEWLSINSSSNSLDESQIVTWFDINGLVEYDPANRTKPTWYSKVSKGEVPYHKSGKNLMFLKSEIDEWLKSGKQKSNADIEAEANEYFNKKGGTKC